MKNVKLFGLIVVMLCLFSVAVSAETVLVSKFTITDANKVTFDSATLGKGSPDVIEETEYSVNLVDGTGKVVATTYFDPQFTAWADALADEEGSPMMPGQTPADHGAVSVDSVEMVVRSSYTDDVSGLKVMKGSTQLYQRNVDFCNENGVCDKANGETYLSCWQDCESGMEDGYCDEVFDEVCDVDCKNQGRPDKDTDCTCGNGVCDPREDGFTCAKECSAGINPIMLWGIIIVVVILLIIIGIIVLIAKAGKKKRARRAEKRKKHKK